VRFEDVLNVLFDRDAGDSYFRCVEKLLSLSKSVMVGDVPVPLPVEGNGVLLGVLVLDLPPSFMVKCLVGKDGYVGYYVENSGILFKVCLEGSIVDFVVDELRYGSPSFDLDSQERYIVERYSNIGRWVVPIWAVGDSIIQLFKIGLGYLLLQRLAPLESLLYKLYSKTERLVQLLQLDKLAIFYTYDRVVKQASTGRFTIYSLLMKHIYERNMRQVHLIISRSLLLTFITEGDNLILDRERCPLETSINMISLGLLKRRLIDPNSVNIGSILKLIQLLVR